MLGNNNNFREAGHIAEEMLDRADVAMDSKCQSVERTLADGIFTLERALKLYKVDKEIYLAYLVRNMPNNC